ncbi:hypothetical protein [Thioclava kandeliae]|uniref:Uncharacterized protein n=1 Tax=Thioclava kandeliae TaxID=3070818 RepID=A0ABV1SFD0_9RHOB
MIRAYLRKWLGVEEISDNLNALAAARANSEESLLRAVINLGRKLDGRDRLGHHNFVTGEKVRKPSAPIEFWAEQTQTGKWREVTFTEMAGHMDSCRKFREVVE